MGARRGTVPAQLVAGVGPVELTHRAHRNGPDGCPRMKVLYYCPACKKRFYRELPEGQTLLFSLCEKVGKLVWVRKSRAKQK